MTKLALLIGFSLLTGCGARAAHLAELNAQTYEREMQVYNACRGNWTMDCQMQMQIIHDSSVGSSRR